MPVHYSTSSSVYSPVESNFAFRRDELEQLNEDADEEYTNEQRQMNTEPSTLTFQTYVTAHSGSEQSENSLAVPGASAGVYDTTPKLDNVPDFVNDETPIIGNDGFFQNATGPSRLSLLPHQ